MTGGQQHVARYQYNRAEVPTHGLACPFAQSNPEAYMNIDACRPNEGFKEPRLLFEHIWRKHTRFFRCGFCPIKWSISTSRKKVQEKKQEHWESCEGKRRGVLYFDGADENGIELMDWKQQELFEKIRSMRDVGAKLEALYKACRKPVPETYHATGALPTVQFQMVDVPSVRITTHPDRQLVNHGEGIFEGLARPVTGPEHPPRGRTTAINVSKTTATLQAGDSSGVSGADRPEDADSGYASMPKNGETHNVSPTERRPLRLHSYWDVPHGATPYAMDDNHLATESSEYIPSDGDDFASVPDHLGHEPLQGYDDTGALLFGLAQPNLGAENSEGPVNIWAFTNLDAEFPEYP